MKFTIKNKKSVWSDIKSNRTITKLFTEKCSAGKFDFKR